MQLGRICLMMSGAAISSIACAQDATPRIGVADRDRPLYDPLGLHVGSLLLYPSVKGLAEYDDNVLASSTGARGDRIFTVEPGLRAKTDFNRHQLDVRSYYRHSFHGKLKTEDVEEYGALGRGVVDVTRRTRIRLSAGFEHEAEDRSSLASFSGSRRPVQFDRLTGGAGLEQEFGNLVMMGRGDIRKLTYKDAIDGLGNPLDMSFRDLTIKSGTGQAAYRLRSGLSLLLRGTLEERSYKLRPGDIGFDPITNTDRSSKGARIEAGVGLELTNLIYGTLRVGYLKQNYRDPKLRDVSGLSYAADIRWNITPLTTIGLTGERSVDETSSQLTAGNLRTEAKFTVDHELLRNLILSAAVRAAKIKPAGPTAKSSEFEGQFSAKYMMRRSLWLEAGYRYDKRSSSSNALDFRSNNVFLAITLQR